MIKHSHAVEYYLSIKSKLSHQQMNKHSHAVEYYLSIKSKEQLTWKDLKILTPRRGKVNKSIDCIVPFK